MEEKGYVLYQINNYFALFEYIGYELVLDLQKRLYKYNQFNELENNSVVSSCLISSLLEINESNTAEYYLFRENLFIGTVIAILPISKVIYNANNNCFKQFEQIQNNPLFKSGRLKSQKNQANTEYIRGYEKKFYIIKEKILTYGLSWSEKYTMNMICKKNDLKENIDFFKDYIFHDHYSFWIYNKHSKYFTLKLSSFDPIKTHVNINDATTFFDFINSDMEFESRKVKDNLIHSELLKKLNSLTRIKLELGDDKEEQALGILSFYSFYSDHKLNEKAVNTIKKSIELKYLEVFRNSKKALSIIDDIISSDYQPGKLKLFLKNLTKQICNKLFFECCSIFLKNEQSNSLTLYATNDSITNELPCNQIKYEMQSKSLTMMAYNEGEYYSYDVKKDKFNSFVYNEITDLDETNWIGICIALNGEKEGVLRVKNKYRLNNGSKEIQLIEPLDISILKSISNRLFHIFSIEKKNNETLGLLDDAKDKLDKISDFNKVFLHEIRTPITKFVSGPERIMKELEQIPKESDINLVLKSVKLKLNDIIVMGNRLKFISRVYYFDDLVSNFNIEKLSILQDIIHPVRNITKDYLIKQYGIVINLIAYQMQNTYVQGDKDRLNIVFNSLIDNAAKYSIGKGAITIYGNYEKNRTHFNLYVENDGIEIEEDEIENIFKKGGRGRLVEKERIGGTGIGLYLSKKLMALQDGDLILSSRVSPVRFCIKIPTTFNK